MAKKKSPAKRQTPKKPSIYTGEAIELLCDEIARQWEYHLITRAAFPPDVEKSIAYRSPPYFRPHIDLAVLVLSRLSPDQLERLKDTPHWLNQNYILRLYAILDDKHHTNLKVSVMKAGKGTANCIDILALLRNIIAHTLGDRTADTQKGEVAKVESLIKKEFPAIKLPSEDIEHFTFPVDTFLCSLKDKCIEYARSLVNSSQNKRTERRSGELATGQKIEVEVEENSKDEWYLVWASMKGMGNFELRVAKKEFDGQHFDSPDDALQFIVDGLENL